MLTRRRTRVIATVAAGAAALAWTVPAAAGPPQVQRWVGSDVTCTSFGGGTSLIVGASFDDAGGLVGGGSDLEVSGSRYFGDATAGSLTGSDFTVTIEFLDDSGAQTGSLTVEGTVEPVGSVQTVDDAYRKGNVRTRVTGTTQQLLVEGDVTAAEGVADAVAGTDLACDGQDVDITFTTTNPATFVARGTGASGFCDLGDGFVAVDVLAGTAYATVALYPPGADEPDLVADGEVAYDGSSFTGDVPVVVPDGTGQSVGVDLAVGALVDSGVMRVKSPRSAFTDRYDLYELTGSVTLPGGEVRTVSDCLLADVRVWQRESSRAGQKPGGKAPVNDLPTGALVLEPGATLSVSTRGAAEAPEAPCLIDRGGLTIDVPFGRTVWYEVEGTGDDVPLDTTGSGFDTVLGVYEAVTLTQVGCVDDSDETGLEASITLPTQEGVTYLVQVGGYDASFGTVVLTRG